MADQSLLSEKQDQLMADLTDLWDVARAARLPPDLSLAAVKKACQALQEGGAWPDSFWMENILMIGANCGASAVLNHGRYDEFEPYIKVLHQEVLDRRWLAGGPTGHFEQREAEGLSRAVGVWQTRQAGPQTPPSASKRRLFGR